MATSCCSGQVGPTLALGPMVATRRVMETALLDLGIGTLVGDKRAFVNFTTELLLAQSQKVLPPRSTVIELLDTVEPEEQIIAACRRLKQGGHRLALDDFVYRPELIPLAEIADIIKICFRGPDPSD